MLPNPVALIGDGFTIYWHGLIMAGAVGAALIIFGGLRRMQEPRGRTGACAAGLIGIPLGVLCARIMYCIFTADAGSVFELGSGGYALYGGLLGVFVALFITSRMLNRPLGMLLDAASPAAAVGIMSGRLAAMFSGEELGYIIDNVRWQKFPISVYVESEGCWRMCVFTFEAAAALITLIAVLALFNSIYVSRRRAESNMMGDVFILLGLLYTTSQTLLESWRTDAMTMRNNAFVRISQVLSAVLLAVALVVAFVRAFREHGGKLCFKDILLWLAAAGCLAVAFVMEFGKNKETMLRNNIVMVVMFLLLAVIGTAALLGAFRFVVVPKQRRARPPQVRRSEHAPEPVFDDDDEW